MKIIRFPTRYLRRNPVSGLGVRKFCIIFLNGAIIPHSLPKLHLGLQIVTNAPKAIWIKSQNLLLLPHRPKLIVLKILLLLPLQIDIA